MNIYRKFQWALAIASMLALIMATVSLAYVTTDQKDYAPGSVVTISGDNSDGAGYQSYETVHVDVAGPNGYTSSCDDVADQNGAWSCQVALWNDLSAVGSYSYTVTGEISNISQKGIFTDAPNISSNDSSCQTETVSFITGTEVCAKATGLGSKASGTIDWYAPGESNATRTVSFSDQSGNKTDKFTPSVCGVWTLKLKLPGVIVIPSSSFSITGCDSNPPLITVTFPPATGLNGWYKTAPVVGSVTASDESNITNISCIGATLGIVTGYGTSTATGSLTILGEGSHNISCSATDGANNTGAAPGSSNTATINIDTTAPIISATINPANPASTYWYNINTGAPIVSFTCSDATPGSGLATACPSTYTFPEGKDQSFSKTIYDVAGNSASAGVEHVNVDLTAPALNINDGSVSSSTEICSGLPAKPTFDPTDGLSGIASSSDSWTPSTTPSGVGRYTYSATATDKAGNTTTDSRTYNVTYGSAFSNFLQPINLDGLSRFKLGSTVPVKFQLACGGVPISNALASLSVRKQDSSADSGVDEAISTSAATTGNLFRYSDPLYIFNLSTKLGYTNPNGSVVYSYSEGSWILTVKLDDGTTHDVVIQIKK